MEKMNILAIGAHPDDIEIGCAGTLIKYGDRGHNVFLLVMTGGGEGGAETTRTGEQADSNKIMGVNHIFWGGYKDTHILVDKETISCIEDILSKVEPDFIFCHFPDDTHQDHRHLSLATQSAARNTHNVLFYEGPTTWGFNPQVFVDIGETLESKIKALEAH